MNGMGEVVALLVLGAIYAALLVALDKGGFDPVLLYLGDGDKWWSPIRKLPGGGHIHIYTKGWTPTGDYATFLHGHILGWYYHRKDHQFYHVRDPEFKKKFPKGPPRRKSAWALRLHYLGLGWVGLYRQRYRRPRKWLALELVKPTKAGEEPTFHLVEKETKPENEHIFFFSTLMGLNLGTILTKSKDGSLGLRITGRVGFNAVMVNPEVAEFITGKWETQTIDVVLTRIKEYIQSKTVDQLRKERDTKNKNELLDAMIRANKRQKGQTATVGLIKGQGIRVINPNFGDFDVVEEGGDADIAAAMRRKTIAVTDRETEEIKADQAEIRGKGRAREMQAEAPGVATLVAAWGSNAAGPTVVIGRAIENTRLRTLAITHPGSGGGVGLAIGDEKDEAPKAKSA